jgi:hypothetical protein
LIFWPNPSIYAVNSNRNWPKTRKYPSLTVIISKCKRDIFGFLFKIDGINERMGPKNHKVVVWGARI